MMRALRRLPIFQKINSTYDHLPRRDQRAVQLLTAALVIFIVYFLLWQPVREFREDAALRAESAAERVAWLQANLEQARQLVQQGQSATPVNRIQDSRSMMSTVTTSAQSAGLSLQRFEPSGEQQMRVWLDNTSFDNLARWLEKLSTEFGIVVDQASIDRADEAGRVNARLTLSIGN